MTRCRLRFEVIIWSYHYPPIRLSIRFTISAGTFSFFSFPIVRSLAVFGIHLLPSINLINFCRLSSVYSIISGTFGGLSASPDLTALTFIPVPKSGDLWATTSLPGKSRDRIITLSP